MYNATSTAPLVLSICHATCGLPPSPVLSGHSFCQLRSRVVYHTVQYCSDEYARLADHDYAVAHAPRRHLDTCVRSSITHRPCYLAVTAKYRFICPRLLAAGHVAASEPSRAGRWGPEPRDVWRRQSPPERGDRIWSHGTHDGTRALPSREARSGAAGRVAVSEPSQMGRQGPVPLDTRHKVI
jgi:hypothetical protein